MGGFSFYPELFECKAEAIEHLAAHDFHWLEHFSAIDLMHDSYGLEVLGVDERKDADAILRLLRQKFPDWRHANIHYRDYERDRGWKIKLSREPEGPTRSFAG